MLAEAIQDKYLFDNPEIGTGVQRGRLYIVYAIEKDKSGRETFFVTDVDKLPFPNPDDLSSPPLDPLPFPAESFRIVADRISHKWVNPSGSDNYYYIKSFKEWFAPAPFGFHTRAKEWGLEPEDQKIIKRYKEKYAKIYEDIVSNWH